MGRIIPLQARQGRRSAAGHQHRKKPGFGGFVVLGAMVAASAGAGVAFLTRDGPTMARAATSGAPPTSAVAEIPVCSGDNRASRKETCIVDGDTGWENGTKWRYEAIDTPEMTGHTECRAEANKAIRARDRLRELMGHGYRINWSGRNGYYGRALVTITLADGRDAGKILLDEELAQPWPNHSNPWCR